VSALKTKRVSGLEKRWLINNVSIMIALAVLCVAAVTVSLAVYYYSNLRSGLEAKAKSTTDFFGNYISQSYNEYYQSCIKFAQTFEEKNTLELQFISTNGKLVASSYGQWAGESPQTSDIAQAVSTQKLAVFQGRSPDTGERIMAVSSPMIYTNGEVIGVLRYVTSMKNVDRQVLLIAVISIAAGLLFIAFMLFISSFFIRSILEPLSQITATAKRIAAGSYGAQIPKRYDDEIGELADTINDMSVKISQAEKTQSEFISSVSHELRTPLTAITGWGETLLTSENLDAETRRGMLIMLREAKRLTGMVEELLEFTRMQDGRFTLNVEKSDILAEFEDTIFMYGSRLKQEGISLEYEATDEEIPEIPCDVARMRQVFLNILDNAAKHGGEGKRIVASIHHEGKAVVVRIRDFGPGIPEEELPHVKMKFYKGSSKARGNGIGLAVCEEIVTMHGGTLTLENAEGGGTLVTISIPSGEE
jgi:two-component system OmpR family sensor kinase